MRVERKNKVTRKVEAGIEMKKLCSKSIDVFVLVWFFLIGHVAGLNDGPENI